MVLLDYIKEVWDRVVYVLYGSVLVLLSCYCYMNELLDILMDPYCNVVRNNYFMCTNIFEVVDVYLRILLFVFLVSCFVFMSINIMGYLMSSVYVYVVRKVVWFFVYLVGVCVLFYKYVYVPLLNGIYSYLFRMLNVIVLENSFLSLESRLLEFIKITILINMLVVVVISIFSVLLLFVYLEKLYIFEVRVLVYLFIVLLVIVFVPADVLLHLVIYINVFIFCEVFFMMLSVVRSYIKKL